MLRIGVIAKSDEIASISSVIQTAEDVHLIGLYCYDQPEIITNYANFLTIEELLVATDTVYISSKASGNIELIEKSIRHQIHTFIEFPFIISAEQGNSLMNLAREANIKLQVSNPLKFTPVYLGLKDQFKQPMFIECHQLQTLSTSLTDTSVIQNLMIKDIDLILSIVQSNVKKVVANGVAVVNGTPDITNARIEFENGCIANLTSSRISFEPHHKMRFFQRNSYINVDFTKNKADLFQIKESELSSDEKLMIDLGKKGKKEVLFQHPELSQKSPILEEIKLFVESIQNNTDNHSTIANALKSIEIAQMILEKVRVSSLMIE